MAVPTSRNRPKGGRWTVIAAVASMLAFSGCWSSVPTQSDPGYVLHHDFSLSPGLYPGALTDCFWVDSVVPNRHALCRLVEGDEEVGQAGNWDVKFDVNGPERPVENCYDLFDNLGCMILAPDGTTYEGCYPYNQGGTHVDWCDYKSHNWFLLYTNSDPWGYVLHTLWDWGTVGVANEAACAEGLIGAYTGESRIDNEFLMNCFDGPL